MIKMDCWSPNTASEWGRENGDSSDFECGMVVGTRQVEYFSNCWNEHHVTHVVLPLHYFSLYSGGKKDEADRWQISGHILYTLCCLIIFYSKKVGSKWPKIWPKTFKFIFCCWTKKQKMGASEGVHFCRSACRDSVEEDAGS